MKLITRNNFLNWYSNEVQAADISDIPNGYIKDNNRCNYAPLLVQGEAMRFYINTTDGLDSIFSGVDLSTVKLNLVNARTGAISKSNVSPLQEDDFNDTFTFYSEVVIDGTVPAGDYYFTIATDSTTYLTSTKIKVVALASDYRNYTARCTFSHDRYFYGVNYQNITSFTQQFRLHINKIDLQEETDVSVYNEVTTGKQRTFNAYMKLPIKLETYYFDEEAHRAAIVMFGHSSIFINGKEYVKKSPYKINTDQTQKTNKGEIEMYDVEFATANRCTLPPEDVAVCTAASLPAVSFPDAIVGTPYHVTFTVSGTAPITDTVLNALPTWMTFTFVDGVADFSGTPDEEGTVHIDINFLNCANAPVNLDKTFTVADNRARFLTPTFGEEDELTEEETANLKGKPGAVLTITLNPLTNNNGGTLKVNSVIVAENDTFTVTLDSNGEGTFTARIDGLANSPSVIRGYFTITATTDGTIGSPDYYQISKVF